MNTTPMAWRCRRRTHGATLAGLAFLLAAAAWLRWQVPRNLSLYVDEFTTLWAARQVQAHGVPLMPSGVLYTCGLLASYIQAAVGVLFGENYTVGRLPSLIFGLPTILLIWQVGRRSWCDVAWLAALGLCCCPRPFSGAHVDASTHSPLRCSPCGWHGRPL